MTKPRRRPAQGLPPGAVLGGEDQGPILGVAARWALGMLPPEMTYGENSPVVQDVLKSDLTAAHRYQIGNRFYGAGQRSGELQQNYIGDKDGSGQASQLRDDLAAISTQDDAKLATAVLGSYTTKYEILREGLNGVQARITITNPMTISSFSHYATGYETPSQHWVERNLDRGGVLGFGQGQAQKIVFRVVVPRNYNYGASAK
ncbi:hypothetical protein [Streptomyces vinaceus]|uniref:hypothetical protein n=1 Tax=Streptomyces vinaceus TaxID=1960 RepID=UPI0037F36752